jgi:hypothetical protein
MTASWDSAWLFGARLWFTIANPTFCVCNGDAFVSAFALVCTGTAATFVSAFALGEFVGHRTVMSVIALPSRREIKCISNWIILFFMEK